MTDDKQITNEQEGLSAAEEAAAIFRAAEEEARRARNPYQTATPTPVADFDEEDEYDYDDEDYDDEEYDEVEEDDYDEVESTSTGGRQAVIPHSPHEIRFINRTNLDEEDVRRLVDRIFAGRKGIQGYRIFLVIFSLLVVIYSIYNIVRGLTTGPVTYMMTGAFLLIMAVVMFYMGFRGVVNQTYKRTLKNAQAFMTARTYHFYDEDFSQTTEAQSYSVTWEDVASWTEDDASFYIIIGQSYAIVHKDGFTMGDEENFRVFLTEKAERRVDVKKIF